VPVGTAALMHTMKEMLVGVWGHAWPVCCMKFYSEFTFGKWKRKKESPEACCRKLSRLSAWFIFALNLQSSISFIVNACVF
jgi:hypothetical protein